MKQSILYSLLAPTFFALISWAPPDPIVNVGQSNDTDGDFASGLSIQPFRGSINGKSNIVGVFNSGQHYASVTGNNNQGNLFSSLIVGDQNKLALTVPNDWTQMVGHSGIIGYDNTIRDGSSSILVSGYSHTVNAKSSFVAGAVNTVHGTENNHAYYSAAIGILNQINCERGWTMGEANLVNARWASALGCGLRSTVEGAVAIGSWNAEMDSDDVFVVGNGTSSSRSTALSIRKNGARSSSRAVFP